MPAAKPLPSSLPLVEPQRLDGRILCTRTEKVSGATLVAQASAVAERLPATSHIINLCEERHHFLVVLLAAVMRGAMTLLPPNKLPQTMREIAEDYPDPLCVIDTGGPEPPPDLRQFRFSLPTVPRKLETVKVPQIPGNWSPICAFTSGSTGKPRAHRKRWPELMVGAHCAARRFGIDVRTGIVATVPPQHMYGLELSVLIPLACGAATYAGCPFFPEDIRLALRQVSEPRILVTTPLHLAALTRTDLHWPHIDFIISATAPLSAVLAERAQRALKAPVFEIYGCTEAGSLASRRTLAGELWTWYDCVRARRKGDSIEVSGDCLSETVILSDRLDMAADGRFRLLGRSQDMLNIAGKRASLADLNLRLNSIEGVEDGAFLAPDDSMEARGRLIAFVVASRLSKNEILTALRPLMDPVFLPRAIHFVRRLPRNETGKLPRADLKALLREQQGY
jgi:acyl-coenzyme A synthetase/AMP-(fatty) acid ligase